MTLIANALWFVFYSFILFGCGLVLSRALVIIARFLRLPAFTVAFVLLALSTTLPELFVGIQAGLHNASELTVGVVIGSNIVNLTLILGMWLLFVRKVHIREHTIIRKDALLMTLISIVPILLMLLGGGLSRADGMVLIAIFCVHGVWLLSRRSDGPYEENHIPRLHVVLWTLAFAIAIAGLVWSSGKVVDSARIVGIELGVPQIFIGLFLLSIGTALPELVVSFSSGRKEGGQITLGDLVGAGVVNSTLVLGVSVLLSPVAIDAFLFLTSSIFMIVVMLLITAFIRARTMTAFEGTVLILLYVLFIIVELTLKGVLPAGTIT